AGFEVVDEQSGGKMNLFGETRLLDDPGKVGSLNASVAHRAGDAEAGHFGARAGVVQEFGDDFAEFAVFAAGEDTLRDQTEMSVLGLKVCEPGIGPTNIAGQNHFS